MQPEQPWETTMNPENARMIQITVEDAEAAAEAVNICMSDEVGPRREFIISELGA